MQNSAVGGSERGLRLAHEAAHPRQQRQHVAAVFGLAEINAQQLAYGYVDFRPYLDQCRFNDCRHRDDKDCAVRAAAQSGSIHMPRYQRFLKLIDKMHLR